jgi:hypothetical protein
MQVINLSATGFGLKVQNGLDNNYAFSILNAASNSLNVQMWGDGRAYFSSNVTVGEGGSGAIGAKIVISGSSNPSFGPALEFRTNGSLSAVIYALAGTNCVYDTPLTHNFQTAGVNRVVMNATGIQITGNIDGTGTGITFSGPSANTGWIRNNFRSFTGNVILNTDDTTGCAFLSFRSSTNVDCGYISRNALSLAVSYNTTSDGRLKTNVRDFTGEDSGRLIDGLRPRWFDWRGGSGDGIIGFIAQEEHEVDPVFARIGAVTVGDNNPDRIEKAWARCDMSLVPILVAEVKSLRQRLALLEN